eukprot:SAG11_NODE_2898_length_2851_cov_3.351381_5_plen_38_part_00
MPVYVLGVFYAQVATETYRSTKYSYDDKIADTVANFL